MVFKFLFNIFHKNKVNIYLLTYVVFASQSHYYHYYNLIRKPAQKLFVCGVVNKTVRIVSAVWRVKPILGTKLTCGIYVHICAGILFYVFSDTFAYMI